MAVNADNVVTFDLQSTRESINQITDRLSKTFEEMGLPDEVTFDLKLAAQEAVVNAVEHGNHCDQSKKVSVTCAVSDDAVTIIVCDEGCGFDPAGVPDPTLPENILREHGRGLFLMRNLCDTVCYNDKGNELTIVKKIPK
jgi:serine/threonine-protein kinase RsbW